MCRTALFSTALICACLAARGLADDADYSETLSDAEKGLLAAMNKERRAEKTADLRPNRKLLAAARIHARNMAEADTGGHVLKDVRPEWRAPEDRIKHVAYRGFAWGENVAWGYPRADMVVGGWMESEGHRKNLLNADFEEAGIGVARGKSGLYWCAVFGRSTPLPFRPDDGKAESGARESAKESAKTPARREFSPSAGESWRYRWHEDRWWYYLPSGRWVVWMDGRWMELR
jgi:uncharacterized protein YkwD